MTKDPKDLRGPECFAWAILNPGFRIKDSEWTNENYYIYYCSKSKLFKEKNGDDYYFPFNRLQPYIEPKEVELVDWYRPKMIWCEGDVYPSIHSTFYKSKDAFNRYYKEATVYEWEVIKAPAKWEDW